MNTVSWTRPHRNPNAVVHRESVQRTVHTPLSTFANILRQIEYTPDLCTTTTTDDTVSTSQHFPNLLMKTESNCLGAPRKAIPCAYTFIPNFCTLHLQLHFPFPYSPVLLTTSLNVESSIIAEHNRCAKLLAGQRSLSTWFCNYGDCKGRVGGFAVHRKSRCEHCMEDERTPIMRSQLLSFSSIYE